MKKYDKVFSILLSLIVVAGMFPFSAFADSPSQNDQETVVGVKQIPENSTLRLKFNNTVDYIKCDNDGYMEFMLLDPEKTNKGNKDGAFAVSKDIQLNCAFTSGERYDSEEGKRNVDDDDDNEFANTYQGDVGSDIKQVCDKAYGNMAYVTTRQMMTFGTEGNEVNDAEFTDNDITAKAADGILKGVSVFPMSLQEVSEYPAVRNSISRDENWWVRSPQDTGFINIYSMLVTGARGYAMCEVSGEIPGTEDPNDYGVRFALNLKGDAIFTKDDKGTPDEPADDVYTIADPTQYGRVDFTDTDKEETTSEYVKIGNEIGEQLHRLEKKGYTPKWIYDGTETVFDETSVIDIPVSEDKILVHSVYDLNHYTINLDLNGIGEFRGEAEGHNGTVGFDFEREPIKTDKLSVPVAKGYIFDYWYSVDPSGEAGGKVQEVNTTNFEETGCSEANPDQAGTLYAKWIPKFSLADFSYKSAYDYTGKVIKPQVNIEYAGNALKEGEDYKVICDENKAPGDYGFSVEGMGDFETVDAKEFVFEGTYTIKTPNLKPVSGFKASLGKSNVAALKWNKTEIATGYYIKKNKKKIATLSKDRLSYNVTLSPGEIYNFDIIAYVDENGQHYESNPSSVPLVTAPKAVSKFKVSTKSKTVTASWAKTKCTKYEVQIATKSNFKSKKAVMTTKLTNTFKKLKKGTKYYVRVRALTALGKTVKYSAWSSVKAIKCK